MTERKDFDMKKILDHIIWILIVLAVAATAAVSIVSESFSASGGFLDFPWWISALLLLFKVAPWLCLALELLITIRDSSGGRQRKPSAVVFNAVAAVLAVFGCAAAALGADSFIVFALPVLWSVVRIIDAIVFRKERERTKLLKSPVFLIVTAVLIVLTVVLAFVFREKGTPDPLEYTDEFSSETILEAWEGEFDEEKLKAAIAEYEKSCSAYVLTEAQADVPFFLTLNYEPKSAKVVRLAPADPKDPGFELKTYIDMTISPTCIANNVAVPVAWWYSDSDTWVGDYPLWSYLLRVTDADGGEHYYYFRVSYKLSSDDTTADDATSNGTTSDPVTDDVVEDPLGIERTILVGTVLNAEGGALSLSVGGTDPNDLYGGVNYYVRTTLADGTKAAGIESGDTVAVTYDGMVLESYPMQIHTVYAIDVVNGVMLESGHNSGRSVGGITYDGENKVAYLEGYVTDVGENAIGVYTGASITYYGATYDYSVRMRLPDGTKVEADLKKWDRIKITFDGGVVETEPEHINSIYSIEVIASVEE